MTDAVSLDGRLVGEGHPPYIMAEACINHQGDPETAKEMVYVARAMGCDAIKFQYHVLDDEMLKEAPQSDNLEKPLYDTLDETNLSLDTHLQLKELCRSIGIDYVCTPFSRRSADVLENEIGVEFYKTGSGELTNIPFQAHIAAKQKPMIVSTGMALVDEIGETVQAIHALGAPLILTHCVSAYPCPYNRVNLHNIPRYREKWGVPVGLSDHTVSTYTSIAAVALGACLIEKHFTLDRRQDGPDHASSLEPHELGELVKGCRAVFEASGDERDIFPEEKEIVAWARESVVSIAPIPENSVITEEMVSVKRPSPADGAIAAKHLAEIIGKQAKRAIEINRQLQWDDIG